jgi:hypothetical protein
LYKWREAKMKAFVSYSWDSEDHKDWVRRFTDELIRNAIETKLDQYDLPLGADRFKFMEECVRESDCVLCVCTPEYVKRANDRERGVGVETTLITPRFFEKNRAKQFIPIIRCTEPGTSSTPDYMASLIFVDFQDDTKFGERMEELLRHLHQQPRHPKPKLGAVPSFSAPSVASTSRAPSPVSTGAPSTADIIDQILNSTESDWTYFDEKDLFVYKVNPEITIRRQPYQHDEDQFHESWSSSFPDPVAYRSIHELHYRGTPIHEEFLVSVDGHRMYIPLPKSPMDLKISESQYKFGELVNKVAHMGDRYEEYLGRAGISIDRRA